MQTDLRKEPGRNDTIILDDFEHKTVIRRVSQPIAGNEGRRRAEKASNFLKLRIAGPETFGATQSGYTVPKDMIKPGHEERYCKDVYQPPPTTAKHSPLMGSCQVLPPISIMFDSIPIHRTRWASPNPGVGHLVLHIQPGPNQLERSSVAFDDRGNTPPHPRYAGAPTGYNRLDSAVRASPPGGYPAQSPPPPVLNPYLPFIPSTPEPIQRGHPYQSLEHEAAPPFASSWPSDLGSVEQSAPPVAGETAGSSGQGEQAESARTLRSVRTQHGDVYAEFEINPNSSSGRWVCQCGSSFVRDSDWERHAVHSLSHGVGGGFDCSICDISFTRYDAMARHLRKKHGGLKDQSEGAEE
ncbi:hypothetical protein EI94DRAFT_1695815 [Lactarius quietus]|nr:hypothetical protein EI94DRAFT_1695815 [Lactarius quietus]